MELRDTAPIVKAIKERFEANEYATIDELIDAVIDEFSLPSDQQTRHQLNALAGDVHDHIQEKHFDYDNVSDQSFPASDPPPVP